MQFNITFKTIFEYILKKFVLCIQIRFVSTEKNTRIASRASCLFFGCYMPTIFLSLFFFVHYDCLLFVDPHYLYKLLFTHMSSLNKSFVIKSNIYLF